MPIPPNASEYPDSSPPQPSPPQVRYRAGRPFLDAASLHGEEDGGDDDDDDNASRFAREDEEMDGHTAVSRPLGARTYRRQHAPRLNPAFAELPASRSLSRLTASSSRNAVSSNRGSGGGSSSIVDLTDQFPPIAASQSSYDLHGHHAGHITPHHISHSTSISSFYRPAQVRHAASSPARSRSRAQNDRRTGVWDELDSVKERLRRMKLSSDGDGPAKTSWQQHPLSRPSYPEGKPGPSTFLSPAVSRSQTYSALSSFTAHRASPPRKQRPASPTQAQAYLRDALGRAKQGDRNVDVLLLSRAAEDLLDVYGSAAAPDGVVEALDKACLSMGSFVVKYLDSMSERHSPETLHQPGFTRSEYGEDEDKFLAGRAAPDLTPGTSQGLGFRAQTPRLEPAAGQLAGGRSSKRESLPGPMSSGNGNLRRSESHRSSMYASRNERQEAGRFSNMALH